MNRPDEVTTLVDYLEEFIRTIIFNHELNELETVKSLNKARAGLEDYIMELVGIKQNKEELDEYRCPDCGSDMKLRTNRQNGNKFWGCSKYPDCRGTRDENGLSKAEREEQKYKKEAAQQDGFSFNRDKRNPVTEVSPPVQDTGWFNPFKK